MHLKNLELKNIETSNDQFKDHVDVGDYNSARRFLVCFLYLNDVKEGGPQIFQKFHIQSLQNVLEC